MVAEWLKHKFYGRCQWTDPENVEFSIVHRIYYVSRRFYPGPKSPGIWLAYKQWNWVGFSSAQQVLFQGYCTVLIHRWIVFSITCFANPCVANPIQSNPIQSIFYNMAPKKLAGSLHMVVSAAPVRKTKTFVTATFFFRLKFAFPKLQSQPRWSHLHFIKLNIFF